MTINKQKHEIYKILTIAILLVLILIIIYNPDIIHNIFTEMPLKSIDYIMNKPLGIEQNTVIKTMLGKLFKQIISLKIHEDFTLPLLICTRFIFIIYSINMMMLKDIFSLIKNKTYNPVKKRFDTIRLDTDQTVLSVFIFSACAIIYMNLVIYYMYFVIIAFALEFINIFKIGASELLFNRSPLVAWNNYLNFNISPIIIIKRIFTGELYKRIY